MRDAIQKQLRVLGVTPWQVIVTVALAGFYIGEMKPRLAAAEQLSHSVSALNATVQALSTKVEVHTVLLASIAEIKVEVRELRSEIVNARAKAVSSAH